MNYFHPKSQKCVRPPRALVLVLSRWTAYIPDGDAGVLFLARSAQMVGVYIDGGDERGGSVVVSVVGGSVVVSEYCADASAFERVFSSLDGRVFRRKPSESKRILDVFLGDESAFHSARAVLRQRERFRRQF